MRPIYLGIIAAVLTVSAATAQTRAKDKSIPLPQIAVPSEQGSGGLGGCGSIQPGSTQSFDCVNRHLQQQVNGVNPGTPTAPLNASSTDIKVGTVNMSAVKQQYGQNFGVSVTPYRPTLTYGAPLRGR